MAVKVLDDKLRRLWLANLANWLTEQGEEALQYKSNELCIPCVDEEGNEKWVQFIVKIPTGSRDGDEFDGYAMREEYEIQLREKAEKAKAQAEKKAKKIERDRKAREAKKGE